MPRESIENKRKRVLKVIKGLRKAHPNARCALYFRNPLELMIATILSAQCTDKRVNIVTPPLFERFSSASAFAKADVKEIEEYVKTTGFYRNKAKNILEACKIIVEKYSGEVPAHLEDLVKLPGVGRKTANVVLGNAFDIPGLTVDTHMIRLNHRLGLTKEKDPVKIEFDLMKIVPKEEWTWYSHLIIHHGRSRCLARKADCESCEIATYCLKVDV
jgi:endonuclease-3